MSDLLLEIGSENLPPHAIRDAFEQLREDTASRLKELRLPYREIYATGTPRRLVVIVRDLAERQTQQTETVTGPPVSRAFDANGTPTQAAVGFARANGIEVADLRRIDTDRGEYLGFERRLEVRRASTLLKNVVPELIRGIRFPKVMRWEDQDVTFARPIRWIVCLLGDTVIPFTVAGVRNGDVTYTVPWIRRVRIRVKNANHYLKALSRAAVVLDHEARCGRIGKLAHAAAKREGLHVVEDPDLVDELTFMLEDPRPIIGSFDRRYLDLPAEIVVTAMKSHQRYLALVGDRGDLMPRFLTFTEGRVGSPTTVRRGNEKVLRARLEDAMFYWHEDVKAGIEGLAARLEAIVFIEGLGTLADKAERVKTLALQVHEADGGDVPAASVARASLLAKADLASEMIKDGKEFTQLQGRIGSHYAREAREPEEIARAIEEHYAPRSPSDAPPGTAIGAYLSVADRIDTITGCFLAGLTPSGSQDPYALRRQANGLLRILEGRPRVSISPLLDIALDGYARKGLDSGADLAETRDRLRGFFRNRVELFLRDRGVAYDVVDAVSAVSWSAPATALERARGMESARGDQSFELLITGAKRVGNILAAEMKRFGCEFDTIDAALAGEGNAVPEFRFAEDRFEDDAERRLLQATRDALPDVRRADASGDSRTIFALLGRLGPTIDAYFDAVLVNCPDPETRRNRHTFLAVIFALFSRYADFSNIVESSPERETRDTRRGPATA